MTHPFSIDQQAAAAVVVKRVSHALWRRDVEELIAQIPSNLEVEPGPGERSLYPCYVIGALSAFMKKDFPLFVWAMAQIAHHPGYEEFMAMYWIAQGQKQEGETLNP